MSTPAELYPTPTRRALLAAVDAGQVIDGAGDTWLIEGQDKCKVRARVKELEAAGWVHLPTDSGATWTWQLTAVGLAILWATR